MMPRNYEFKARCSDFAPIEAELSALNAEFIGVDHQVDTYFNVPNGRLKLREGNIENALIHYSRGNETKARTSNVTLYKSADAGKLKLALTEALGVLQTVEKTRRIFFVENVKIHLDELKGLGSFVEVEAIDTNGIFSVEELQKQCEAFAEKFAIEPSQYIGLSYSELVEKV